MLKRIMAVVLGISAGVVFGLAPLVGIEAWLLRRENPEGLITPMWYGMVATLLALVAWRVSDRKSYAWEAGIGIGVSFLTTAVICTAK